MHYYLVNIKAVFSVFYVKSTEEAEYKNVFPWNILNISLICSVGSFSMKLHLAWVNFAEKDRFNRDNIKKIIIIVFI